MYLDARPKCYTGKKRGVIRQSDKLDQQSISSLIHIYRDESVISYISDYQISVGRALQDYGSGGKHAC